MVLNHFTAVTSTLGTWFGIIVPFVYGFGIAYVLNIPFQFFKDRVFGAWDEKDGKLGKWVKPLALVSTYISVLIAIFLIAWFIIPQLVSSVNLLVKNIPLYLASLEPFVYNLVDYLNLGNLFGGQTSNTWTNLLQQGAAMLSNLLQGVINYVLGLTGGIYNWLIGLTVSIYLLSGKDSMLNQLKKVMRAFLPTRKFHNIMEVSSRTNYIFNHFIKGSLKDSIVVGILCFIGMSIFGIPYALLVSVIQGITNIIPIFGPFIGAIPSTFIILMVDPVKALIFVIFILVLQQIDGNIIQPRIVGNSIGLPGIWVLFAIVVFSGLFGIIGLIIGVPTAAVVYAIFREYVNKRLKDKENSKEGIE